MNSTIILFASLFLACDGNSPEPTPPPAAEEPAAEEPAAEEPAAEEAAAEEPAADEAAADEAAEEPAAEEPAAEGGEDGVVTMAEDGAQEVTIGATDQMKFTVSTFEVKAGTKVRLTLEHRGKLPKNQMGHNLVILKEGIEMPEFAIAAGSAPNYFPEDRVDQTVAHTEMIGGGEKVTIEFTAPAAGTYTYVCTYPGHFAIMNGTMVVK